MRWRRLIPHGMKNEIYEILLSPVASARCVFWLALLVVVLLTFLSGLYDTDFYKSVLVEAHGMLFDILVIGVVILWLQKRGEKQAINKRYEDEIDDFRGWWGSEEAARRIRGNIVRLNRNGITKIDLSRCYLRGMSLEGAKLRKAKLVSANLREAFLMGSDLREADCQLADFREAKLNFAKFHGANLYESELRGAELMEAKGLTKDNLHKAKHWLLAFYDTETLSMIGLPPNHEYNVHNLKFVDYNLKGAHFIMDDLHDVDFRGSNLSNTVFVKVNLDGADLGGTDLRFSDLEWAQNLTVEQLCKAKSLYGAKLPRYPIWLKKQIEEDYAHLFEKPPDE